jgi:hypothetical protein
MSSPSSLVEMPPQQAPEPAEVELVLSALEAASPSASGHDNRRAHPRRRYHVQAELRLFSDSCDAPTRTLYTRDVSVRGLGFITRERLPLGYGGVVNLTTPSGQPTTANGTLFRCREIGNGWFEGALYFNREQWAFETSVSSR